MMCQVSPEAVKRTQAYYSHYDPEVPNRPLPLPQGGTLPVDKNFVESIQSTCTDTDLITRLSDREWKAITADSIELTCIQKIVKLVTTILHYLTLTLAFTPTAKIAKSAELKLLGYKTIEMLQVALDLPTLIDNETWLDDLDARYAARFGALHDKYHPHQQQMLALQFKLPHSFKKGLKACVEIAQRVPRPTLNPQIEAARAAFTELQREYLEELLKLVKDNKLAKEVNFETACKHLKAAYRKCRDIAQRDRSIGPEFKCPTNKGDQLNNPAHKQLYNTCFELYFIWLNKVKRTRNHNNSLKQALISYLDQQLPTLNAWTTLQHKEQEIAGKWSSSTYQTRSLTLKQTENVAILQPLIDAYEEQNRLLKQAEAAFIRELEAE